jgi:hypothetical protein
MLWPRLLLALQPGGLSTGSGTGRKRLTVRGRWAVGLLAAGVALDLLISAALISQSLETRQAASSAHVGRAAAYDACELSNQARRADLARWQAIVVLLSTDGTSPGLARFVAGVERADITADRPEDCATIGP